MRQRKPIQLGLIALLAGMAAAAAQEKIITPSATPSTVSAVRITGVSTVREETLHSLLQTRPGEAFDAEILERDIQAVEKFYHKSGYPLAHVTSGFGIDAAGVVTIPVDEGRVEKIIVKGNKKTRPQVILRQLDTHPGDVYTAAKLARDRQRLYDMGFFYTVAMVPAPGSDAGKALLTIDVNERQTGNVMATAGYTSSSGMLGYAQWADANFMGTGQTLSLKWQRGTYGSLLNFDGNGDSSYDAQSRGGYDINYFTPWIINRRNSAGLRIFDTASEQFFYVSEDVDPDNVKNYEWRRGIWLTAARDLGHGITLGLLGRSDNVDFDMAPEDAYAPAGTTAASGKVHCVRLSAMRGRLNPLTVLEGIPQSGMFLEIGQANSEGINSVYQKLGFVSTHYFHATKKDTFATRVQLGWSLGEVPFSELYAVGGPQTVRSYPWNEFLGNRMFVMNTELRHEIRRGMAGVAFVDLGYAWPQQMHLSFGDLAPAVGLGLRFTTPFGPIRLDYAYGREGGRAHLTTGDSF